MEGWEEVECLGWWEGGVYSRRSGSKSGCDRHFGRDQRPQIERVSNRVGSSRARSPGIMVTVDWLIRKWVDGSTCGVAE